MGFSSGIVHVLGINGAAGVAAVAAVAVLVIGNSCVFDRGGGSGNAGETLVLIKYATVS